MTKKVGNLAAPIDCGRSRKEVFQPHLPVRLPCYDLAPVTGFTLGRSLRQRTSGTPGFHGLTGGVYKLSLIHISPRHRRLGGPLPRQLANVTHAHPLPESLPLAAGPCSPAALRGIRRDFSRLSPCNGQVAYALLTRAPVAGGKDCSSPRCPSTCMC